MEPIHSSMHFKLREHILAESTDYVVIQKPAGLLSIPDREGKDISLKRILQEEYGTIFTVHRLDRDTSGVILFAKSSEAHAFFSAQFEERNTEKIYLGLLVGSVQPTRGTIDAPIAEHPAHPGTMMVHKQGKEAITDFEVAEDFGIYSLVHFQIHTGRTHQIRVHARHIGHPVACDKIYGDGKPILLSSFKRKFNLAKDQEAERPILDRLGLHASRLRITGPDGISHTFEAPLPKDLKATLQQLRKRAGK